MLFWTKLISLLLWLLWNQPLYAKLNVDALCIVWASASEKRGSLLLAGETGLSHTIQVTIPAARPLGSFHDYRLSAYALWPTKREILGYLNGLKSRTWWLLRSDLNCRVRILKLCLLPSHLSKQDKQNSWLHFTRSLCEGKHRGRTKIFCLQRKMLHLLLQIEPMRLSRKHLP